MILIIKIIILILIFDILIINILCNILIIINILNIVFIILIIIIAIIISIMNRYKTVFAGIALGISTLCVMVEIQQRFQKRRVLAFVILASTGNAGNIISGYLTGLLIQTYGWRGTMFINATLMLHAVACSLLISIASAKKHHQSICYRK